MALVAGDALATTCFSYFINQVGLTTFHHSVATNPGGVTEPALAQALADLWQLPFNACMTSAASFKGVALRNFKDFLLPNGPIPYYAQVKISATGAAGNNPLPRQVAGLISIQSLRGGRGGKGRRYIPFPDQASNEPQGGGSPTAAYLGALRGIANLCIGNLSMTINGNVITLEPRHQVFNKLPLPGNYEYVLIDNNRTRTADGWATQRRRGTYGKTNVDPFL